MVRPHGTRSALARLADARSLDRVRDHWRCRCRWPPILARRRQPAPPPFPANACRAVGSSRVATGVRGQAGSRQATSVARLSLRRPATRSPGEQSPLELIAACLLCASQAASRSRTSRSLLSPAMGRRKEAAVRLARAPGESAALRGQQTRRPRQSRRPLQPLTPGRPGPRPGGLARPTVLVAGGAAYPWRQAGRSAARPPQMRACSLATQFPTLSARRSWTRSSLRSSARPSASSTLMVPVSSCRPSGPRVVPGTEAPRPTALHRRSHLCARLPWPRAPCTASTIGAVSAHWAASVMPAFHACLRLPHDHCHRLWPLCVRALVSLQARSTRRSSRPPCARLASR